MMRKASLVLLAVGALVFINSGCVGIKKKEWKPIEPQKTHFVHTVQYAGETLNIISEWYTGDANNWEILANANPQIDYTKIVEGNKIFIPENLLKTREPLTEKFIDTYLKKDEPKEEQKKEPIPKTETPPKKKDKFDLFGPK